MEKKGLVDPGGLINDLTSQDVDTCHVIISYGYFNMYEDCNI